MSYGVPIDPERALNLPVDRVALALLAGSMRGGGSRERHSFLVTAEQAYSRNGVTQLREVMFALAEAFDWLEHKGLIAEEPGNHTNFFVTRLGREVMAAEDPAAYVAASARLDVDLHPSIASRVRAQFILGEYELAALAALRQVEIRVREMTSAQPGDIGVALMTQAFREGGPLRDITAEKGEAEAMMSLFRGAIGVFKNPVSHRQVDYADPTLASEVVLLADLLLRILDSRQPTST
jgi:uncharacterized protein (TIGR02391 family)